LTNGKRCSRSTSSAPFNVTRLSIPCLKQSSAGVILMMSSLGDRFGYPNHGRYATTKRGLIGLTETLALELGGAGIRINTIARGAVVGDRLHRVLQGRLTAADAAWTTSLPTLSASRRSNVSSISTTSLPWRSFSLPITPDRYPGRPPRSATTPQPPPDELCDARNRPQARTRRPQARRAARPALANAHRQWDDDDQDRAGRWCRVAGVLPVCRTSGSGSPLPSLGGRSSPAPGLCRVRCTCGQPGHRAGKGHR
jgi:NAD(P)-dependent dehydrogenase (short-subunit alcohol dehydrogenase family)